MAIPYAPDWRWLLHREDCPWYPTMRLFRQTEFDNWEPIFGKMAEELASLVRLRRTHFDVPMSTGEFCDYWTSRRTEGQDGRRKRPYVLTDLRQLDDLGHALATDPELQLLVDELEDTNSSIALLRAKLSAVALDNCADPSLAAISRELSERENRRVRLIEELNASASTDAKRQSSRSELVV